jgi:hypothetical protein
MHVRPNNNKKDKYFDCKLITCSSSINEKEISYKILKKCKKIKTTTKTTTLILPIDISASGLEKQTLLLKTTTVVEYSVYPVFYSIFPVFLSISLHFLQALSCLCPGKAPSQHFTMYVHFFTSS